MHFIALLVPPMFAPFQLWLATGHCSWRSARGGSGWFLRPFFLCFELQTTRHRRYLSRTRTRINYILVRGPRTLC
jgi:hypothetical protein